jgi:phage shock protein PspC (stress-responsive transcriptional regulator)
VLAGVAGGLGRYFSIDPVVIRVGFIVASFIGGAGFIAYIAAWVLVPSDDGTSAWSDAGVGRRLGFGLGILVLTAAAVVGGFWAAASGGQTVTAIVVIGAGVLLLVGALTGGMRWLILPALGLALAAGIVAAADLDIRGGTGERIYRPVSDASLRPEYKLGVGHLRVDLRNAHLTPGEHRIHLKLGVGQAEVLVPRTLCVSSTAHVAGGATTVFDRETGGTYHDWQDVQLATEGRPHLTVDADIGFGQLRIEPDTLGQSLQVACAHG